MKKIELLAPAGSKEAAIAAVQNGADAIYLGFGDFNARRNAKNFTAEEMSEIVSYCRARGVKTHITLNTLLTDREFPALEQVVRTMNAAAPNAVIVADLGVARALRELAPDLCLHASTQLTVHSVAGAQFAADMGFSRVVLSRELSESAIASITHNVPIEIEVFVHGALCMCYSGQCYMSGVIGKRSGNRGLCAQPCRLPYRTNPALAESYPLSLRDLCLAHELPRLRALGVDSLKIEGRMKRPEYVAVVCGIYSRLLRENRLPTEEELETLRKIFSRGGFTDGYFKNKHGSAMFGTRAQEAPADDAIYKAAQRSYESEHPRIPVSFSCCIEQGEKLCLSACDVDGNTHHAIGCIVEPARNRAIEADTIRDKLSKTGGTPFYCDKIELSIAQGCAVPVSAINALRRECLDAILELRGRAPRLRRGTRTALPFVTPVKTAPTLAISVHGLHQISETLLSLPLTRVYFPLHEISDSKSWAGKIPLGVTLPQIIWDEEWQEIAALLQAARELGIDHAMVSNVGHIAPLHRLGFTVEGDIGLNVFNSDTLHELERSALSHATLSPELKLSQIRDIRKGIPCEIVAYGRLPLMITENCAVKDGNCCPGHGDHILIDRRGARFPVFCMPHHRNLICNSDILYLADKMHDLLPLGLSRLRLLFTNETAEETLAITKEYLQQSGTPPQAFTRGLYYRGVE